MIFQVFCAMPQQLFWEIKIKSLIYNFFAKSYKKRIFRVSLDFFNFPRVLSFVSLVISHNGEAIWCRVRNLTKNDRLAIARGHTMGLRYHQLQLAKLFRTGMSTLSTSIQFPDRSKLTLRLCKTTLNLNHII